MIGLLTKLTSGIYTKLAGAGAFVAGLLIIFQSGKRAERKQQELEDAKALNQAYENAEKIRDEIANQTRDERINSNRW